jgi:hypothetical protein
MLKSIKKELSVSLFAMSALVLPVTAQAVELNTSPLYADSGQSYHACNVANVSTASVILGISILSSDGVWITGSSGNISLNAGASTEVTTNKTYTGFAYCRINLPSEAGSTVRANLTVFHYTGAFFDTLALSEAR